MIQEGLAIVRRCLRRNRPGAYQLQAAINAVHADAPTVEQSGWSQIVALYDHLLAVAPTPVVALNRAIAIAIGEVQGPAAALALVEELDLDNYLLPVPRHASRSAWAAGPAQRGRGRLPACGRHGADGRRAGLPEAGWPSFALSEPVTSSKWPAISGISTASWGSGTWAACAEQ